MSQPSAAMKKNCRESFLRGMSEDASPDELEISQPISRRWRMISGFGAPNGPATSNHAGAPGVGVSGAMLERDILEIAGPTCRSWWIR